MSQSRSTVTARAIADDVFGRETTREIWSGNYTKALPLSIQDFELRAILPAVFYMFRFGCRRGKGKFLETFGGEATGVRERKRAATVECVASKLAERETFEDFDGETGQAILGDLLLSFCLENAKRALGKQEQVQRVAPAHYMSCWLDLPDDVANLRYVPEMIVAVLANQKGEYVQLNQPGDKTWFAVGRGFEENVLLRAFSAGVSREGELGSRTSDRFREETEVGLDQLLTIRLSQTVGAAPDKLRGRDGEKVSNQRPIAEKAAEEFSEDIRRFVKSYAAVAPRHAFVELLESCVAVGLTTILTRVIELLCEWMETGVIRQKQQQSPAQMFVDCSNGVDKRLRSLAEQSLEDFMRRVERRLAHLDVAGALRDIFTAIYPEIGDIQGERIRRAIKESFAEKGWEDGHQTSIGLEEPAFDRFLQILRSDPKPDRGLRTLLSRLDELDDYGFFRVTEATSSLWDNEHPTVIRIHTTQNDNLQRAFAALVFYSLYKDMFTWLP